MTSRSTDREHELTRERQSEGMTTEDSDTTELTKQHSARLSRRQLLGAAGATVTGVTLVPQAAGSTQQSDGDTPSSGIAIVVLEMEPLARHSGNRPDHANDLANQRNAYKGWLARAAPEADIISEWETVLHGLAIRRNGTELATLRGGPNVRYVTESVPIYPTMGESLELIGAENLEDDAGEGVKIAILDTGIEHTHDFFDPEGFEFPDGFPKGNGDEWDFDEEDFTTEKVIAAYAFWDDEDVDIDPGDWNRHGTHVAGTASGRAETETDLSVEVSGVAPGAWLGNYNVFAGGSPTATENVIDGVEQAVEDGFDVINMSLGGPISDDDPLMEASESAIEDGVVVVSSAGNAGPGEETVTSPAAAPNVTAVGASTNNWAVFDSLFVSGDDIEDVGPVAYVPGVDGGEVEDEITDALLVDWAQLGERGLTTELACDDRGRPTPHPNLVDEFGEQPVVIVQRGDCAFSEKAQNIKDANGKAMIVYNTDDAPEDELVTMTLTNEVEFPSVFITNVDGFEITDQIDHDDPPTVDITFEDVALDREANVLAEFSSRGPGPDLIVKPDVTAPGVNIYSSVIDDGWASLSGTSMSSPHVAGAAAVVLAKDPDREPLQVKSALVNTADLEVEVDTGTPGPMSRGNGLLQVPGALNTTILAEPATVSFGRLARAGPATRTTATRTITIENVSENHQQLTMNVDGQSDLTPEVTANPDELELDPDEIQEVTLTAGEHRQNAGDYWGQIQVAEVEGPVLLTVPFWYRVGR